MSGLTPASLQIPAARVYEDDRAIAIRDIDPKAPVHVLVLPREHIASAVDCDEALAGHLVGAATTVARQEGIADAGFRLVVNTGAAGGQTVGHLHVHVLGGRPMTWPPG